MNDIERLNVDMKDFFNPLWPGEDKPLVFGEGNEKRPPLMLVGEAPGETEVMKKRPFVGKAGKNLDEFLSLVGLDRANIYVTNVVKIRPTETGSTGRLRNRAPSREELMLFIPWLEREIACVAPGMLVTLGNVPLRALSKDEKITIGDAHGALAVSRCGLPLFALYHPASIIYRRELRPVYERDVLLLAAKLREEKA